MVERLRVDNPIFYFAVLGLLIGVVWVLVQLTPMSWFHNQRNQNLEGLRGFLAPSVFFHHAVTFYFYFLNGHVWTIPPSRFFAKMGSGPVTMFFFLTGYLFWQQALMVSRAWSARQFFKKRFWRLAPAFYMMTAAVLISSFAAKGWSWVESPFKVGSELGSWLLFGLPFGQFQNFNGYADTGLIVALVFWTLRFEWLYYLCFPGLRRLRRGIVFTGFLLVCWLVWGALSTETADQWVLSHPFFGLGHGFFRDLARWMALGFVPGMLVSYAQHQGGLVKWASTVWAQGLALAALLVYFIMPLDFIAPILNSALLAFTFLVVALDQKRWTFLHRPTFQLLGQMSYGIYLYHGISLYWVLHWLNPEVPIAGMTSPFYWSIITGCGIATLAAAYLSYRYVEKPIMARVGT